MLPGSSPALNTSLSFLAGDTWGGIPLITIKVNGAPPNTNVQSAVMEFSLDQPNAPVLTSVTSAANQIHILSASGWTFTVDEANLPLDVGSYKWRFRTLTVGGVTRTYLRGTMQSEAF